ncbi:betaamylase [Acanthamoeba castellanii str. Neff]|uniref:Beta-amylase n=1 Tax=Acanthamoeba castellanii (strain ATCC 30010 / Neff) TaxID=1257118 RepID=L8GVJ7_ACACF|nr:betaamylase [Acanthamoeba castellanii str. Neff]ELR16593.1 betaamylase [Acanthamoeba castellanii str. Neff]
MARSCGVTSSAALFLVLALCVAAMHAYIPVNLMMPLDTITNDGALNDPQGIRQDLQQLKNGGVDGVMVDVWWGVVERAGPRRYNWTSYLQLVDIVDQVGLKIQFVTSFHQCGTNVGDQCFIPLPPWVLSIGQANPDIYYRDREGGADDEYLSLGVDYQPVLNGRTALQVYADYMSSLEQTFRVFLQKGTINQIQVGMGPAGELRYPSYQLSKWSYCGVGEFQCYDKYMLADLDQAAIAAGHPDWGNGGPDNAGTYDSNPEDTGFFSDNGGDNYSSPYGRFFLNWYSNKLLNHSDSILKSARQIFSRYSGLSIAGKVSGIHWWYNTNSHAAELTAGYYNTNGNNGYLKIAQVFSKYGANFDFTALEMVNSPNNCGSAPETLVKQTILAAQIAHVGYDGENALELCSGSCSQSGFQQIIKESTQYGAISGFTYLRLTNNLIYNQNNWNTFLNFVNAMHRA